MWIVWNILRVHQQDSFNHLKDMLRGYDVSLLVILEPKTQHSKLARFAYSIGFLPWLHGGTINTHIWIFWKQGINIEPLWASYHNESVFSSNKHDHPLLSLRKLLEKNPGSVLGTSGHRSHKGRK